MADSQREYATILQSTIDVITLILFTLGHILYSIVKIFLPSSYEPVKRVNGEIVLITGGGSGLGRLIAIKLAKLKATVVVWDINEKGLEETVNIVRNANGKAYGFKCDLTKREDVYKIAEQTKREVGQVTILINNAGVVSGYLLLDTPDDLIQRTFDVNAISHFWTTKAFLPKMIENNHGHIVTISSMAGHSGVAKLVDYCSSKYAAVGFDEALRIELEALGVKGVKTTVVCPYFIQSTGMFTDVNSKYLPRLTLESVADSVVTGILREDLYVFAPKMFRYVFWLKWVVPWPVTSMVIRNMVHDACPTPRF